MQTVHLIASVLRTIPAALMLAIAIGAPALAQQTDASQRLQWYENHLAMKEQVTIQESSVAVLGTNERQRSDERYCRGTTPG